MSRPGQPHISQAIGGEVVEVGQGGQVQEDHIGQVIYFHRNNIGDPKQELAIDDVNLDYLEGTYFQGVALLHK